ncbi:hypothetical protein Tco_0397276 [Tanacetum coccineum]
MMYFPLVPSTDYELHPVNRTQDLIVHKIDDPIPTEQVELMDEKVDADPFQRLKEDNTLNLAKSLPRACLLLAQQDFHLHCDTLSITRISSGNNTRRDNA